MASQWPGGPQLILCVASCALFVPVACASTKDVPAGIPMKGTVAEQVIDKMSAAGDLHTLSALQGIPMKGTLLILGIFGILRLTFPLVFQGNSEKAAEEKEGGEEPGWPPRPGRGMLDWIKASVRVSIDDVQTHVGLDSAMLLEFSNLCIKITATIGLPMCAIICPVNFWLGNRDPEEVDDLSRISMSNVQDGSWLFWVHAVIVWLVVHAVEAMILNAQERFLKRRYSWLKSMPPPRSTTILVENIPDDLCSDDKLRDFFSRMFKPEDVKDVHVVRLTENLQSLNAKVEQAEKARMEAEKAKSKPEVLERLEEEVVRARRQVQSERARLRTATEESSHSSAAFVTFAQRQTAEIALRLQYFPDAGECVASIPPQSSDIRWGDLRTGPMAQAAEERIGFACVAGLYLAFTPFVIGVSSVTNLHHLQELSPLVRKMVTAMPQLSSIIEGVLASLALTTFLSFLPTFMMLIFDKFYVLKADMWAQAKLQIWYFWFQIVFILLVTAIGSSFLAALEQILQRPMSTFSLLADSLPGVSHFYLNFMVMQWVTHALNLTRYINLIKFLMLRMVYDSRQAKELSEPEDQDYYGIGSRSARWTVNLVIGLVFSSICPLISLLVCVNFLLCRLIYGYLIVFAEVPKVDLGGVFFVRKLIHVQHGLVIYLVLMVGVLYKRSDTNGPAILAGSAFLWLLRKRLKFDDLQWENLPFSEIVSEDQKFRKVEADACRYIEPELQMSEAEASANDVDH
eukprot:gb/GFBE01044616.1/.p1 GENE.gb/GFBE01044616.1/~~gb/GFBE01044616.1/.p1  ORF type:complete len:742 (+),score=154.37 gb/GFBE01044616.1/:1-2226(+)